MQHATLDRPLTRPTVAPFAKLTVLPVVAVVFVAQFAASFGGGYWLDEVYMLAIGRNHLDWGSADQPPLAPLLAAAMDWIAPGSLVALRLPAVLATAAAVLIAALIAREFGGDRRAQTLTAAAQATTLWTAFVGHWLTPYTLEPVEWLAVVWLLTRWLRTRDDRLLPVLGAVVGIAAETKFQVLLLGVVLVAAVLGFGPRALPRRQLFLAGVGIAVLIALPTLLWQAANGWPQLHIGTVVAAETASSGGRPVLALELVAAAGVAGTVLALYGLWRLLRHREYRFLAVTFLVLYLVFVVTEGRLYYLSGLYGLLTAAGAVGLQRRREAGRQRWRWAAWPAFAVSALVAGALLVTATGATDSDGGARTAAHTAAAYHALPADRRAHTAVLAQSYVVAAYLDAYSARTGLPPAHSTNRGYGWFPPPADDQTAVLYVGPDPGELRPYFASVHRVDATLWLCEGRRAPWASFWTRLRHLDVDSQAAAGLAGLLAG